MEQFKIRSYTKKELALLYFPNTNSPRTAVNHLMAWIARCTPLVDALQSSGYRKTEKMFTPRHVAAIIEWLGEP